MKPGVTILICTYNGKERLQSTLKSISTLRTANTPCLEIILVDNASNDGTSEYVHSYWKELNTNIPILILNESTPGKINAQNLGLKHVKTSYVLICDDDNELCSNYLEFGYDLLNRNPIIGALGGQGIVKSTVPIPTWFSEMAYNFACAPQAEKTGDVRPTRNVIYGAGMFMAMAAYKETQKLGFEYLLPSRTGNGVVTGAEDGELCWWLRFTGYEIWYAEELTFYHHISPSRLTEEYRTKLLTMFRVGYPIGKLYLRIFSGELNKPIRFFWQKELVYTLVSFFKLPFQRISDKHLEYKRCWFQILYFLRNGKSYNEAYQKLLKIYLSVPHG